mmetsp:Transcript_57481/g.69153  ORF Transcript_57481/g.69153 Transcript_57481/m.69153 type:complete len:341 (-) Transcript_57481:390-1412(-)
MSRSSLFAVGVLSMLQCIHCFNSMPQNNRNSQWKNALGSPSTKFQNSNNLISRDIPLLHNGIEGCGSDQGDHCNDFSKRKGLIFFGSTFVGFPLVSNAAAGGDKGTVATAGKDVALRLRRVPTFTIVDNTGLPVHIFDGQSAARGYFFLTYKGAEIVLDDAKNAAVEDDKQFWDDARIISLPLDFALQLSLNKTVRKTQSGQEINSFYTIVSTPEDINSALNIDGGNRFKLDGAVPLFFIEGMKSPKKEGDGFDSPVYFQKNQLIRDWVKSNPDQKLPPIKVLDLRETFVTLMKPGGNDDKLKDISFVTTLDAKFAAMDCSKKAMEDGIKYNMTNLVLVK